ncbi:MAG TPA: hypothetical protein VGX70_19115 [Gemmataceae bacterium]|nr:hypothetical protein [Gemmataceae bacterium]
MIVVVSDNRDHPLGQSGLGTTPRWKLITHKLRHGLIVLGNHHFLTWTQLVDQFR